VPLVELEALRYTRKSDAQALGSTVRRVGLQYTYFTAFTFATLILTSEDFFWAPQLASLLCDKHIPHLHHTSISRTMSTLLPTPLGGGDSSSPGAPGAPGQNPQQPFSGIKPKRTLIESACAACRKRKSKVSHPAAELNHD